MKYQATILASAITAVLVSVAASAGTNSWKGESRDAWLDGKIETALMLNGELNNFDIDTKVHNRNVTLAGVVNSEIEKDLAEEITENVEGVEDVTNNIQVDANYRSKMEHTGDSFARTWNDLSTTAGLNMKYAVNDSIEATSIDVDTKNGVVTLTGTVRSEASHDLAIEIAKGYDHVKEVKDNLEVKSKR